MIVELIDNVSTPKNTALGMIHTKEYFFPIQLTIEETISNRKRHKGIYERRPWIHMSEPVDFQLPMVLPCVNHVAVPR